MKKIYFLLLLYSNFVMSQTPQFDNSMNLKWSEEFNFNLNGNATKQQQRAYLYENNNSHWDWYHYGYVDDPYEFQDKERREFYYTDDMSNHEVSKGNLTITVKKLSAPLTKVLLNKNTNSLETFEYEYTGGRIKLKSDKHKNGSDSVLKGYGYYEIRQKLPDYRIENTYGIGLGFWLFGANDTTEWCEIDFYEIEADKNTATHNFLYRKSRAKNGNNFIEPLKAISNINLDIVEKSNIGKMGYRFVDFSENRSIPDSSWHKFAAHVTPYYIDYFIDDNLIHRAETLYEVITYDNTPNYANAKTIYKSIIPMEVELGVSIRPGFRNDPNKPNTNFAEYKQITDYIRYYKQKYIDSSLVLLGPNINRPFNGCYKYIKLGSINLGNSIPTTFIINSKPIIKAEHAITIEDGFEIPIGREIYLDNINPY